MPPARSVIRRRALRLVQDPDHPLFVFALTGDELAAVAEVSRVSRDDAGRLIGYQRPEVKRHVNDIVSYLNGDRVLFPNPIILALSSRADFTRSRGPEVDDGLAAAGTIEIPLPRDGEPRPAWIVDGQQRAHALARSKRAADLPVLVSAFVADEVELQRDQFLRVNNTRPLPTGLITELLPEVSTNLPARLAARKVPAALCDWLNTAPASPFCGLIRRSSDRGKRPSAVVADTSVVKMIEESLSSASGCLFPYRNVATNEIDADGITAVLVGYWSAVKKVFPEAWGRSPARSRLMHGAGIRAMGRLMDRVMAGIHARDPKAVALAERELRLVAPVCRWTSGEWEGLNDLPWNEVENTPRHIRVLSNHLIRAYLQARNG